MIDRPPEETQSFAPRVLSPLFFSLLYLPLVAWVYRHSVLDLDGVILGGARVSGGFAWQLWWPFHALKQGEPIFTTPWMFWPESTFYFFHTPINEGLGLLLQRFFSVPTTLNLLHLLHAWLGGVAAFFLARRFTRDDFSAFLAGCLYTFSYYAIVQRMLGHLGIATIEFLPLLLLAFFWFEKQPTRRRGAVLAIAWCGACLTDPYLAWFGAALPLGLLVLWRLFRRELQPRSLFRWATPIAIGSIPVFLAYLPLLLPAISEPAAGGHKTQQPPLTSLIDPPFWHPHPGIQAIREQTSGAFGFGIDVGELQLYLGFAALTLLCFGFWKGWLRKQGTLLFLAVSSAILALGPWLRLFGGEATSTSIPLPYLPFSQIPFLSLFRSTNRAILPATLCVAVLAGIVVSRWRKELFASSRSGSRILAAIVPVAFLLVWGWEFALWRAGGFGVGPVTPSPHYQTIAAQTSGSVVELPVTYSEGGYPSLNAHPFLLHQSIHQRPLAFGFPARYSKGALRQVESRPFLYALTHPGKLYESLSVSSSDAIFETLASFGRRDIKEVDIRCILLHTKDPMLRGKFRDDEIHALEQLLTLTFGPPSDDGYGNLLWLVGEPSDQESGEEAAATIDALENAS